MANLFAVIASKSLMKGADTSDSPVGITEALRDMRWLELTAAQHLVGALVAIIWLKLKKTNVFALPIKHNLLIAAFANAIANMATNISFSVVSSAITQIVKAFEPIFTFFLSFLLGGKDKQVLTSNMLLSVAIMVTGSCIFISSDATFNIWGIAAAVSSNMAFPVRNIFLKKSQQGTLEKYAVISVFSSAILAFLLLFKILWVSLRKNTAEGIVSISLSAIFHCSYNLASVEVLQVVSPLTHAVLNLCKRITIIVINVIYFDHAVSAQAFVGLLSFGIGIALYTKFARMKGKSDNKNTWSAAKSLSACLLLVFFLWNMNFTISNWGFRRLHLETNMRIMTSWVYDQPMPSSVLTNVEHLQSSNPHCVVDVFCGTNRCLENIAEINNPLVKGTFLRTYQLFNDTPLFEWQQKHIFHKILAGQSFEDHLHHATQLSLLWKFGGLYISPFLSCSSLKTFKPGFGSSWTIQKLSTNTDSNIIDLVYFKDHHPIVWELMELFAEEYHKALQNHNFEFNFTLLAKEQIIHYKDGGTIVDLPCKNLFPQGLKTEKHYGVLVIGGKNVGDEIQGFAGAHFFPYSDSFLIRDRLRTHSGTGNTTVFLNAWYGGNTAQWPPPDNIHPFMFSIHLETRSKNILGDVSYLKNHSPIGARDISTLQMFANKGVDSYFSGCATLLFKNPSGGYNRNSSYIYITDVKFNESLLPNHISEQLIHLTHTYISYDEIFLYKTAMELLMNYSKAKVVITQRIHCALPCVALGIPIVFINDQKLVGGSNSRTSGLLDLFHTIDKTALPKPQFEHAIRTFNWDSPPPNPNGGKVMRFRATFWNIIRQNSHLNDTAYRFGVVPYSAPDHPREDTETFHLMYSASELNCSHSGKEKCSLKWYQWRSLESILYHHPYDKVFLHSTHLKQSEFDVLTDVGYQVEVVDHMTDLHRNLRHYFNKTFHLDSHNVFKDEDKYLQRVFPIFLVYFWGGVYVKNDIIALKSMRSISINSLLLNNQDDGDIFLFLKFRQEYANLKTCFQDFRKESSSKSFQNNFLLCSKKESILFLPGEYIHKSDNEAIKQNPMNRVLKYSFALHYDTRNFDIAEDEPATKQHKSVFNRFCVLCNMRY